MTEKKTENENLSKLLVESDGSEVVWENEHDTLVEVPPNESYFNEEGEEDDIQELSFE